MNTQNDLIEEELPLEYHTSLRGNALVILVASIAAVPGILFGYDTGVISGSILYIYYQF